MANTVTLKRKISSIKNTRQITKAMELVSASKMRKAQDFAKLSRDYSQAAAELLADLSNLTEVKINPFFNHRKVVNKLYIVVSSNSGLAGAYNYNVLRLLSASAIADRDHGIHSIVIAIGKQAANFAGRLKDVDLEAVYFAFGDKPTSNDIKPILDTILLMYKDEKIDQVDIIYTQFISNLSQVAKVTEILPIKPIDNNQKNYTNFEPSVELVLDYSVERLLDAIIWQAVLDSLASEHSMRMMAMKNATDNAGDLIDQYTLKFNTARQSGITQDLAEISGGFEALNS
ncbi:MAG TPA: ATP synthase F1 subunit gamma [Candidatus Saccharimonadales bacterium]|jgi:F-type H+-transporting ATPase subunit gamma|nr:ATP synthase F1 subunit gamma [Candidatus Saccharimonadales bacterium]